MAGKRKAQNDTLYKVYLDVIDNARLQTLADRLYLHPEDVILDAIQEYFSGLNLQKIAQKRGARDDAAKTVRDHRNARD